MDLAKQLNTSFSPFYKTHESDDKVPILEQIIMPEIDHIRRSTMKPRPHPPFSKRFLAFKYFKER